MEEGRDTIHLQYLRPPVHSWKAPQPCVKQAGLRVCLCASSFILQLLKFLLISKSAFFSLTLWYKQYSSTADIPSSCRVTECNGLKISQRKHLAAQSEVGVKQKVKTFNWKKSQTRLKKKLFWSRQWPHQKKMTLQKIQWVELEDRTARDILLPWWRCFPAKALLAVPVMRTRCRQDNSSSVPFFLCSLGFLSVPISTATPHFLLLWSVFMKSMLPNHFALLDLKFNWRLLTLYSLNKKKN